MTPGGLGHIKNPAPLPPGGLLCRSAGQFKTIRAADLPATPHPDFEGGRAICPVLCGVQGARKSTLGIHKARERKQRPHSRLKQTVAKKTKARQKIPH